MSRYFIAIVPSNPLQQQITHIKQHVAAHYNSKGALRSPAHITLHMPFDVDGKKEERFLSAFDEYKSGLKPFQISLNDFSCFEPRVIFISVKHCETLIELRSKYVDFMKREFNIFNQSDDLRGFHPHITVAFRDLKKPAFYEAWSFFEKEKFEADFLCEAISLLRLEEDGWHELKRVSLQQAY